MRVQMIKARFAACIADGLPTVRATSQCGRARQDLGVARRVSATLRC